MTVNDLISSSFRLIGVLSGDETPSSSEANSALQTLSNMLDAWALEQYLVYAKVQETFAFIANQQIYQMGQGAGADFNTVRPQKIENADFEMTVSGSSTIYHLMIEELNQDQWSALSAPNTGSNIPTKLFVSYGYPNVSLYFWPLPLITNNLYLWSWKPIGSQLGLTTLTTTVAIAPGYTKAIIYNLAVNLAPEYGQSPPTIVIEEAIALKANIKRMNTHPIILGTDAALVPDRPGFNWLTGNA